MARTSQAVQSVGRVQSPSAQRAEERQHAAIFGGGQLPYLGAGNPLSRVDRIGHARRLG